MIYRQFRCLISNYRITQANFEITQQNFEITQANFEITQGIFQKTQGIFQKTQGKFPKTPKTGECICGYRPEKRAKKSLEKSTIYTTNPANSLESCSVFTL